ncbi:MAG: hypothetical protein NZ961_24830, partial [Candidatus Poribacteria bacterium]|nr:hypothetical protein [Candidatus Poribacteria bacterium]
SSISSSNGFPENMPFPTITNYFKTARFAMHSVKIMMFRVKDRCKDNYTSISSFKAKNAIDSLSYKPIKGVRYL